MVKRLKRELKLIDTPTKKEVIKNTFFVLIVSAISASVIAGIDVGMSAILSLFF